ncbi:TIGR03905 family TSCPD domain-containing protein [bacterium]|nr:TIGR03905 family TSCPD domain-containing protein [bacterium]
MKYQYATRGTCSELIFFDIDENTVVTNIKFIGGCNGNLKAVSKLVDGWTAAQIADKLLGNECGYKGTSCADQLAKAVLEAAEKVKK